MKYYVETFSKALCHHATDSMILQEFLQTIHLFAETLPI
jgi:hypothetical protein